MFGDDVCFLIVVAFLKALVGKSRVYSLSSSSFPKEWPPAGLGNLLFVVQTTITTDPRQKHSGMTIAFAFLLVVIPECYSPGSVVIKQGKVVPLFGLYTQNDRLIYPRTLRAGSWRAACSPLG